MNILYLVRHGESETNTRGLVATRKLNEPLTPRGRLQAEQTAQAFVGLPVDALYCSSLRRAVQTAEIIGCRLGLAAVPMDEFVEMDMGPLEGQPLEGHAREIFRRVGLEWDRGAYDVSFDGGEDYRSMWARMRTGLAVVLNGRSDHHVIIVGHAGLFSHTLRHLAPSADLQSLRGRENMNCSISELQMDRYADEWLGTVVRWADVSHLTGEAGKLVVQRIAGL